MGMISTLGVGAKMNSAEATAKDRLSNLNRDQTRQTAGNEGTVAEQRIRSFVDRIDRLQDEKDALAADMREVYAEAKGEGFDTKILRSVVRILKMDKAERQENEALLELYMAALGEG